jgi:hypothetical protein
MYRRELQKSKRSLFHRFTCKGAILFAVAVLLSTFLASTLGRRLSAGFVSPELTTHVEIDGAYYGAFDQIKGLKDLSFAKLAEGGEHSVISLNRDIVTDPSLFRWAGAANASHGGLKDVHIVMRDVNGNEVSRYVLKLCKPLSWTFEAVPTPGGYHERVDLAVQEIAIY